MDIFEVERPLVGDPSRAYLLQRVLELSHAGTRLLDAGCGTGSLWQPLIEKIEFELWGIDIDERSVEAVRGLVKAADRIKVGDARNLSRMFSTAFFDTIVSTQVFYQVGDLKRALREIYLVLKPGGRLLFTTELPKAHPSLSSRLLSGLAAVKGFFTRQDMPKRRDDKELSILLEEAGFRVESTRMFHIPPLKYIHNKLIADVNKNRVMRRWLELEEELNRDANFLNQGKRYFRNLFMEAVKKG